MTDTNLNSFIAYGTHAQRLAFTPSVPTPASGPSPAYVWYETDTGLEYTYASAAWHLIGSTAVGNVSGPASSTDRAVATWNSTGGVLLRDNSAVTIDASGNITTSGKATITGNVSGGNLTTAGNVTGTNIGNITSVNLNGNGSTVLLGNGTFGVAPSGSGGALSLIATNTPSSGNTSTFNSIPNSYSHLLLLGSGRSDAGASYVGVNVLFNGDTGANYDWDQAQSNASTAGVNNGAASTTGIAGGLFAGGSTTANRAGYMRMEIFNYKDTNLDKVCFVGGGSMIGTTTASEASNTGFGGWRSTSAITQIDIVLGTGNYTAGTRFSLYGLS